MNLTNLLRLYDTWSSSKRVAKLMGMDSQEQSICPHSVSAAADWLRQPAAAAVQLTVIER
jgi:hypothetical protein